MLEIYITKKFVSIIIGCLLVLTTFSVTSCREDRSIKKDRYKEKQDETTRTTKSIHESNPRSFTNPEKMRNYDELINIQLQYARQAKTQAQSPSVKGYASKLLVEYQNNLIEMEKLIGKELPKSNQSAKSHTSNEDFTLEATDTKTYDQVFLETSIALQMETRDVLWEKQKTVSNNDLKTFYEKLSQEMELQIDYATNLLNKL